MSFSLGHNGEPHYVRLVNVAVMNGIDHADHSNSSHGRVFIFDLQTTDPV